MRKIFLGLFLLIIASLTNAQVPNESLIQAKELANNFQYEEAIELLHAVIENARKEGKDSLLGHAYIRLGTIFCDTDKIDIGLEYYKNAQVLGRKLADNHMLAMAEYGLAAAYQTLRKFDSAVSYYSKVIPYFQNRDSVTLSYLYSNLSLLNFHQGDLKQMQSYSRQALNIQIKLKDSYGSAASYSNLALYEHKNGNYQKAIEYYKASAKHYLDVDFKKGYSESIRSLANVYRQASIIDSAARYFFIYDSIGLDLFHQDYQDKILELETKYNTAELERDNALQEAELEESHKQLTILIAVILILAVLASGGYYLIEQRRKRIKAISDQKIKDLLQSQEMETAYALLDGQDQERKRIAAELHDNLGSILVSLNMFADSLTAKSDDPKMQEIAERISKTSKEANETVRQISHSLDTGLLKHFGLKAAISQLAEAIEMSKNIKVDLHLNVEDVFNNEIGLELYRMIQELFNNALKHADCSTVRLELNQIDNSLNLIFEDNGKGFDVTQSKRGMGLSNLETRAEKLGGELKIDSKQGRGSTFIIEIQEL